MIDLFHLSAQLQDMFISSQWKFCFIGGIALQRWGEPRLTRDIDVCLLTGFGGEEPFIDRLLEQYQSRVPDAKAFALTRRVLLLQSASGIGIDIALGGLPFEETVIGRASQFEFLPGLSLLTCSAEDLVIFKSFADRGRDWADVETIIIRQQGNLDWPYIVR
ncbi:MAG: nucleotidyl transferase AbiEii/AbiGii toxin family protein [Proteobacteria bacterium]|nr:nucleotidyl transferase AbiEii/AbiGii toxin family protein [Pseudomonadota bacterium]